MGPVIALISSSVDGAGCVGEKETGAGDEKEIIVLAARTAEITRVGGRTDRLVDSILLWRLDFTLA